MLFNSVDFAVFLPIVFLLYWFVVQRSIKWQNALIVVTSYVFYGWWDWKFLSLIVISTLVDFLVGKQLGKQTGKTERKILLWISILVNLGFLAFFKYYNFFLENFITAFSFFGAEIKANSLNVILPIGISFYTFQTLSYTIDVYKNKLKPTNDFVAFAAFVAFFPQLVAGPIERASNLLPQFFSKRVFDYSYATDGLRQILWGLFAKVVIADNCAVFANQIFNNSDDMNGSSLLLGALFFSFQIYGDFSGYSNIAIGTARLFGFNLMQNFAFPYFSRDIAEFWRRWHISLSTWFRDYLYIPMGGSRGTKAMIVRNTFVIFIISGFWHGANWTFLVWGALNAVYFLPLILTRRNRKNMEVVAKGKLLPSVKDVIAIAGTFGLTVFAWIFFRAENMAHAMSYISNMFSSSLFETPNFLFRMDALKVMGMVLLFVMIEWFGREGLYGIGNLKKNIRRPVRWVFYYLLIIMIYVYMKDEQEFIYFQF